jgi:UPF0755 protein
MKKRIFLIVGLIVVVLFCGTLGFMGLRVYTFLALPPDQQAQERIILIERGMSLHFIAESLESNTIITDRNLFMLLALFHNHGKSIKAGEYKFNTSLRPVEVLAMLQEGKIYLHTAKVPEGFTSTQIAELLEDAKIAKKAKFLKLLTDKKLSAELKIDADSLEGYLFPNTYYFPRDTPEADVIREMVRQFWLVMTPELQAEIKKKGFALHEIVTLASIIEKETYAPEERALVSAVYHNRLKINMKLDSDPTVIYGLAAEFDGNLTRSDLQKDTTYNTYRRPGLPPGPIANPGKAALLAAVRPADVKYLYFVSKNNGTHEFSVSYSDHLQAVQKYQRKK